MFYVECTHVDELSTHFLKIGERYVVYSSHLEQVSEEMAAVQFLLYLEGSWCSLDAGYFKPLEMNPQ